MKKAIVALVVILLLAVSFVYAQPGERMKEQREHMRDALNLTDQQESQMKKLRLDLERKQAQVQTKIRLARLDMKEMFLSDKIDRQALEKTMKQVTDLQYQVKMNRIDFWFSVNGILTPDQQNIWKHHVVGMAGDMRERLRGSMRQGRFLKRGMPERDME